jgi:hypothetical protein
VNGYSTILNLVPKVMVLGVDVALLGHIFGFLTLEASSLTLLLSSKTQQ